MSCCCPGTGRFFDREAVRYRRRFARKGFEPSQRHLFDGVLQAVEERGGSLAGVSLLEIGCGVGYFHQRLLAVGAARAVGIDVAEQMLEQARSAAAEGGMAEKTDYLQGDFVVLADAGGVDAADITVLDKVVCCYPNADALLSRATQKTERFLALTYPRDKWFVRLGIRLMTGFARLLRWQFHPFAHAPEHIAALAQQGGFERISRRNTLIWLTEIYRRVDRPALA